MSSKSLRLSALYRYPVKSLAGERVSQIEVDAAGPIGDRRWMVVDATRRFVSQRTLPAMARIVPREQAGELRLVHPERGAIAVATPDGRAPTYMATVWADEIMVRDAGDEVATWLSTALGAEVRLVALARPRAVDPTYAPGHTVGFADGFPFLIVGEASVSEVARRVGRPIGVERFRPNIVIAGAAPFEEDSWSEIRVGGVTLKLVKPCSRCVMVDVDPATGTRDPGVLAALAEFRRRDGAVYVGQNATHRGEGALVEGAEVEVLSKS